MPIPTSFSELSETATSNSPAGSETVGPNMNEYIQQAYSFIKMIYDGQLMPTAALNFNGQKVTNIANGVATSDAATVGQLANYLPLSGGVVSGNMTVTGGLGVNGTVTAGNQLIAVSAEIGYTTTPNNPYIDFHSSGYNIDYDARILSTGGNSGVGNAAMYFYASGGFVYNASMSVSGTVTAYNLTATSDERLKSDWRSMKYNFIEKLAKVQCGSFKREGSRKREVGVSAQSLRKVLREAVFVSKDGTLTVAYGNAALTAAVELSKEVVKLRARIKKLELKK